ncbi:MAG: DUF4350 domain-containing protein [Spirochaetaceae bacterium]|nr:DUF4350 domain-containing protein [Spirochaetaceae bacterium]
MRKHAIPFFLIMTALAIIAIFAYNLFEIYENTTYKRPSRQARTNEYLAMERWLNRTGHAVRVIPYAEPSTILSASEKTIVVLLSSFRWQPDTYSRLQQWIENGGNLILCINIEEREVRQSALIGLLSSFGVEVNFYTPEARGAFSASNDDFPTFSSSISFAIHQPMTTEIFANEDAFGKIRLVRIPKKNGSITLSGNPVFMTSHNLNREKNALLSWSLTGEQDIEKKGVLFIRGIKTEHGFFGKLAERGNFSPLLISVLVLIVVGFWMVIPVFGFLTGDEERPGKPMRERFLAEARFLKKYKRLGSYLEIYYLSLKQRFRRQYGEIIDDDSSFFSRLAEICNLKKEDVAEALCPSGRLTNREFIKHIYTIETIMERL